MKKYEYINKPQPNGTKTTYKSMQRKSIDDLFDRCELILKLDDQFAKESSPELRRIHYELNKDQYDLIKKTKLYGGGYNSIRSIFEGLMENFGKGQFNISSPQMPSLEKALNRASLLLGIDEIDEVEFVEVSSFTKTIVVSDVQLPSNLFG